MKIDAIIFDMDNTLYDERQYVRSGFRAVSEHMAEAFSMDKDMLFRQLMRVFSRNGRGEVFDLVLEKINMRNQETVLEMVNVYRNHLPTITVFKGARVLLRRLRQRYRLGLITDGVKSVQEIKVKALNIASFFDVITYSVEHGGKNNIDVFLTTLERLKIKSSNSIYVDDNPTKTFAVAKKLGIHTIRILKGENKNIVAADEECKPDFEIRNLTEILGIIHRIEST